jgi:hypothetical protein
MLLTATIPSVVTIHSEAQPLLVRQEVLMNDNNNYNGNAPLLIQNPFEYTFEVNGTQIFPNDTIKNRIVTEYQPSVYNISSLQYNILDHSINASNVQIHVVPTKIDEADTRLDFQIYANDAEVTGPSLNKNFNNLEITSAYGIYNRDTNKMTIHVPYSAALQILL